MSNRTTISYNTFKQIYAKKPDYFQKRSGREADQGAKYDYYGLSQYTERDTGASGSGYLTVSDYDKYVKQYQSETQKAAQAQTQAAQQASAQKQAAYQSQADTETQARQQAATDAELARLQQQLVANQQPQAAGVPTPTPIEQVAAQYQKQIQSYQQQLSDTQTTLFTQLAQQQAEQQKKATDMFAGYQQYTDQLRGDWQAGLSQTQSLIGSLQQGYQNQLIGLQGIFNQSLEESRAARETESQERARIQGLLQEQAQQAVQAKESQQRFQQSAELVSAKKQQDLTRSFNRASSQATFGVLSNQRRRGGAGQTIFSDEGTTSQNPYGYSNIFFS